MPCTPAVKGKASRRRYLAVQWCVWRSSTGLPTGRYGTFSGLARDDITLFLLWLLSLYSNSFFPLSSVYSYHSSLALLSLFFFSPFFPCPLFALRFLYSIHVLYSIPLLCFLSLHSILPLPYLLILSYFFFCLFPLCIKAFAGHTFPQKITVTETTSSASCSPRLLQHQYCHYF